MSDAQIVTDDPQDVEVIKQEVAPVIVEANGLTVKSAEDYAAAGEFLKAVKRAQKMVRDHFGPMKTTAHAAWKTVCGKETETLAPLDEAEKVVKGRMLTWYTEQERQRRAEERRLQAEAEERARKERERLEREAERLKTPEKKEERLEQAEQVVAAAVHVESAVPKITGQGVRKVWRATVTDSRAAISEILGWPDWAAYITLNTGELNRFAARTKGQVTLAGVEFAEQALLSSTGK